MDIISLLSIPNILTLISPLPRRVSLSVSSRLTRGGSAEWGLCAYVGSPNET